MISISDHGSQRMIQFDGTNFINWKYRLEILLDEKDLKKYIERKLIDILADEDDSAKKDGIKKEEKSCVSIIVQSIHDSQLEYIRNKSLAKDMIDGLAEVFQRCSIARQLMLKRELLTMKMQAGDTMNDHFLKFEKKMGELKNAGAKMDETEVIVNLFLTLPKSYDNLVTALQVISSRDLTLDFAKGQILDEYNKRNGGFSSGKTNDSHAMNAKNPNIICFKCGKKGHIQSQCRSKRNGKSKSDSNETKKSSESANNATDNKSTGHTLCVITQDCVTHNADACVGTGDTCTDMSESNNALHIKFILDSGATDHMVNKKRYFCELSGMSRLTISVAKKNQRLVAKQQGNITVETFYDGLNKTRTIKNVLFVPDLQCNLLSVQRLMNNGFEITFKNKCAYIMLNGITQFVAHQKGKLYEVIFHIKQDIFAGVAAGHLNGASNNLWHFRLGHLNAPDMKKLISKEMVIGMNGVNIDCDAQFCESCVFGKQTKLSFPPNKNTRSTRILELIHTDVCGPMSTLAWDGSKYFVTFTDDFSRATMVYCIERKSDVLDRFKEFVAAAEALHGSKVAKLKADNGGEYISHEFKNFCRIKGIQLNYTVPYNPQMNSVSERLNRTLVERARTMLLAANIEWKFWSEAVLVACYLKNRSPTRAVGKQFADKTPAQIWFGRKPDLSSTRIFGSICYNYIPADNRKKLEAKSSKCIMLGYGTSLHTYRLWDIEANKLIIGRHVTFNEREILKRAKVIEIADSGTDFELNHESAGEDDEFLSTNGDDDADNFHGTDSECTGDSKDIIHSTKTDCVGNNNNYTHGTDLDCTGDFIDDIHGVEGNGTGNDQLRRSNRVRKPVQRYGDYEYGNMVHALSACEYVQGDPTTIAEAKQRPDWLKWQDAINDEYASLMKNKTWSLCGLPKDRKTISCKWVFKLKYKANGNVDKYKARLVARGFTQMKGFDYNETYSPTAKLTTFRVLMAIAVHHGYYIHQMDVKCAFLNGFLNEEIYMNQPEEFNDGTRMVCKLNKSLYGLKQASRMWNERFHGFMSKIGFNRCLSDHCLYIKSKDNMTCYILLYVDDLLIISDDLKLIETIKRSLFAEFEMTDLNEANNFLGINIIRDDMNRISLDQTNYFERMLQKFGMVECKAVSTPMESALHLEKGTEISGDAPYRELIGCLTYATLTTRPDLCAATNFFSRFQSCYGDQHFVHAKRILRYIQGTKNLKLIFEKHDDAEPLIGYTDADWGGDKDSRKSTSGFVYKVYGNTVGWSSKKQPTVSLSSTEAEYIALCNGICEGKWLRCLLHELNIKCNRATTIYEDNQSCIKVAAEPREHQRMKHIDIKYNFIREAISIGEFEVKYIPTTDQLADIMTKGLGRELFIKHRMNLNLR